jgi:hypothetical protein
VGRKPDDEAIGAFFGALADQPWLGYTRRFWPRFFFHVTDVHNAASILASGRLVCRNRAQSTRLMVSDNASAEILGQTAPWLFDYVRLYFRPRTPTFFRNEGIRPYGSRDLDAHCPMPVALLFDARDIAGRAGVQFSNGNLASPSALRGEGVTFLRGLDFRDIYHEGPMAESEKPRLTSRRQAEVIVPGELGLGALRFVVTRSDPERQTLLTLLRDRGVATPVDITVDPGLFHGQWTYIERVALIERQVRLVFNPDTRTPGPFATDLDWSDPAAGGPVRTTGSLRGLGNVAVSVPPGYENRAVRLTVSLDDCLAFSGTLEPLPSATIIARH